jgi:hypothetical protein
MPSIVRGYHGTTLPAAEKIVRDRTLSRRVEPYHWLGQGIYFWENAPVRAWAWALYKARTTGDAPAIVSANIVMRNCLDLLDIDGWRFLIDAYQLLRREWHVSGKPATRQQPPFWYEHHNRSNKRYLGVPIKDPNVLQNYNTLDCEVIERAVFLAESSTTTTVASVRGAFFEGQQLYGNSFLFDRNHVQIAVRDPGMISDLIIEPEDELKKRFGTVIRPF